MKINLFATINHHFCCFKQILQTDLCKEKCSDGS